MKKKTNHNSFKSFTKTSTLSLTVLLCLGFSTVSWADFTGGMLNDNDIQVDTSTGQQISKEEADEQRKAAETPLADLKYWGKDLAKIEVALDDLKSHLIEEEWFDYEDYAQRFKELSDLLKGGEKELSGKSRAYLFALVDSYNGLLKNRGFQADARAGEGSSQITDGRQHFVFALQDASENLMRNLVNDKHIVKLADGSYEIEISQANSVVRDLAKPIIEIVNNVGSENLTPIQFKAFNNLKATSEYIKDDLAGLGDQTCRVRQANRMLVDTYDYYSAPGREIYERLMKMFNDAVEASEGGSQAGRAMQFTGNRTRRSEFKRLAGQIDNLIGIMTAVKSTIGYGVGYESRTYNDVENDMKYYRKHGPKMRCEQ